MIGHSYEQDERNGPVTEYDNYVIIEVSREVAGLIRDGIGKLHPIHDVACKVHEDSAGQVTQVYLRLCELLPDTESKWDTPAGLLTDTESNKAFDQPHHGHDSDEPPADGAERLRHPNI